jgi:hypothetical protein
MTLRGAELLRTELKRLKGADRPQVIKAIAEARAHGDLSENAEYHAAREQQGFIEGRIGEIEARLGAAEVIDVTELARSDRVVFGVTVDLEDQDNGSAGELPDRRRGRSGPEGRADLGDLAHRARAGREVRGRHRGRGDSRRHQVLRNRRRQDLRFEAFGAGAFGSGMIRPGLAAFGRYSTATCPMRWTRALRVRFASSANIASRASRSVPEARTLMSS